MGGTRNIGGSLERKDAAWSATSSTNAAGGSIFTTFRVAVQAGPIGYRMVAEMG